MQVGFVSDTHDHTDVIERAVEYFSGRVDAVVHCGDFVAPLAAMPFDDDFEFYAVRGNNDGEWALRDMIEAFGTYLGEMGELTFEGTDFAVYHGTSEPIVDALVESGRYDYVVHGHTHERVHEEREATVRLNPGGIPIGGVGEDEPQAAIVVDTNSDEVTFHDIA